MLLAMPDALGAFGKVLKLAGGSAESLLEASPEMRHVGKSPPVRDFANSPMRLRGIFKSAPAPQKPPSENQAPYRSFLLGQHFVCVAYAYARRRSYGAHIEIVIRQPGLNHGAKAHERHGSWR